MPLNERNDPEMAYRRGYQDGALETLHAVDRFLDPAMQQVVRSWAAKGYARSATDMAASRAMRPEVKVGQRMSPHPGDLFEGFFGRTSRNGLFLQSARCSTPHDRRCCDDRPPECPSLDRPR
jgi:hypothetical protein